MQIFNSLFWQLYLGILTALAMIIILFASIMAYSDRQNEVKDFTRDVSFVSKQIIANWTTSPHANAELLRLMSNDSMFHISLKRKDELQQRLKPYKLRAKSNERTIYQETETQLFISVQKFADSPYWLLIEDIDIDLDNEAISEQVRLNIEEELREESQLLWSIQLTGVGLILLIGVTLMVLVRRISLKIEGLASVSNSWANGHLSVRADTRAPTPLNKLAISLNKMAADLNQTLSEQQVMTHAISHELRTPLSKIQLALTLLTRKYKELQSEPLSHDLERYIDELEYLVNQILTFAKFNHLKEPVNTSEIDISNLVTDRVNELKLLNKEVEIELVCQSNLKVKGDLFHLQIVIDNILKNALKYANRYIKVSLSHINDMNETNAKKVKITIEDDGPGIPNAYRESILIPFARVDESRARESGGYGLGLAIVDAIVKHHDGTLILSDSPLGGLCLSLTFYSEV